MTRSHTVLIERKSELDKETGMRPRLKRVARLLGAALLAVGVVVAPTVATAANAAPVESGDTVHIGNKIGYGGTGLFPIWTETPATGDPSYFAYCLENRVTAKTDIEGHVGDIDSFLGSNHFTSPAIQGKVLWVLAHSYPALSIEEFGAAAGVPGISQSDAIEATQYAIWRYTDLTWDAAWAWKTEDSKDAYWYLVDGANASDGLTPGELEVTADVTAPAGTWAGDELIGPFTVSTNQAVVSVATDPSIPLTDAAGNTIDANAVVNGQSFYLDLRGTTTPGSATVTVSASGSSSTGKVISVPTSSGATPTADNHAQSIILVAPSTKETTAEASISWQGTQAPTPSIRTSAVNPETGDRNLPWYGGWILDTVTYQNLTPGFRYEVTGELMLKTADGGQPTGITGSTQFVATQANGSVYMPFLVERYFPGQKLVAFETLATSGPNANDPFVPIAWHEDINDAAQTMTIGEVTDATIPALGTTLVDSEDGDHVLGSKGGTVVDTVTYSELSPDHWFKVTGELMNKADGSGTGITGTTGWFQPSAANGSIDVAFTVPEGYAGKTLVAFETLWTAATPIGAIAAHGDINDAAQTVTVEEAPEPLKPVIGTSLVDAADQDHVLAAKGGTLIDTIAYQNLTPGTQYTVTGELMNKADGLGTGITGSTTFTPTEANGSIDVTFVVPTGYAGKVLVAFETLAAWNGYTFVKVAEHADINDAAQTVTVEKKPVVENPTGSNNEHLSNTGGSLPWVGAGVASLMLVAGAALFLARRKHAEQ